MLSNDMLVELEQMKHCVQRLNKSVQSPLKTLQQQEALEQALEVASFALEKLSAAYQELQHNREQLQAEIREHEFSKARLRRCQQEFRTLVENAPDLIARFDKAQRYVYVNPAVEQVAGKTPCDFLGKTNRELGIPKDNLVCWENVLTKVFETGQVEDLEFSFATPQGQRLYCVRLIPELGIDGIVETVLGICRDITPIKEAQAFKQSQAFLQAVIDANPNLIYVKDIQGRYVLVNQALADFYGVTIEQLLGSNPADWHFHQQEIEMSRAHDAEVLATKLPKFFSEQPYCTPSGEVRWFQTIKKPLFEESQVSYILGVCTDISERKLALEQLRLAFEAARMGFWDWNMQTGAITWSKELEQLYGVNSHTYDKSYEGFLSIVHPEDRERLHQNNQYCSETKQDGENEFRVIWPDGSVHWIYAKFKFFYDEVGNPVRKAGIDLDITERKLAEMQVRESLREKEVLLQEIHHRVKNNLQVISSLLDLQSQHIEDPTTQKLFQDSKSRVKSMALIHEKLYESKNLAYLNFAEYLEVLSHYLFQSYQVSSSHITLRLKLEPIILNTQQAIPCGLIINELISNALKHAFPNQTEGLVEVYLSSDENQHYVLIVRDNGMGLPRQSEVAPVKALGLQLVKLLTAQLEGILEINSQIGTEFCLRFPKETSETV